MTKPSVPSRPQPVVAPIVLEGLLSVEAALHAGNRDVEVVYVARDRSDRLSGAVRRLRGSAKAAGVSVVEVDRDVINDRASGTSHGGVIAVAGPRRFAELDRLVEGCSPSFVVMLDGIEDPYNFGQAVRAIYAAGADGLVVRPRHWGAAEAVVARSSAGASERMPTALAQTPLDAATALRGHGLTIACATRRDAISIYRADLTVPVFLLMGGERRGVTRSFLDQADLRLAIPSSGSDAPSLGSAAAAAVLAFEVMRQRGHGRSEPRPRRSGRSAPGLPGAGSRRRSPAPS